MNTRKRTRTVLTFAAVTMAVLAGAVQAAVPVPAGNNPATGVPWVNGDTYRLTFITSSMPGATLTDIADYNALVQALADAAGLGDATWKVIGSTADIDARDNTLTNPDVDGVGEAIFLIDGTTVVANNYADLWDGGVQHIIDQTETGDTKTHWPFTGTYTDGTTAAGKPNSGGGVLGSTGQVSQGDGSVTTHWIWRQWTADPPATALPLYALSDPLVFGGDDPNLPAVDAGDDWNTWSGEPVTMNATVTNNSSDPVTDLTYAWTVDDNSLADTNLTIEITNDDQEDATVKITKTAPTGDATVVTMTLAGNNEDSGENDVTDTMTIDVYDDSCLAAQAAGTVLFDPTDFNADCITNLKDFALMAAAWLYDYTITAPEPEPQ